MITPDRRQSKTSIPSTNEDKKSLETEFSIAICDKWQSKTLFLAIFDPLLSIVKSVFDSRIFGVMMDKEIINYFILELYLDLCRMT